MFVVKKFVDTNYDGLSSIIDLPIINDSYFSVNSHSDECSLILNESFIDIFSYNLFSTSKTQFDSINTNCCFSW